LPGQVFIRFLTLAVLVFGQLEIKAQNDSLKKDTLSLKNNSGIEVPIDYSADDSMVLDLPHKLVYLYGNAKVHYETINLDAGFIMVNFNTKEIIAKPYRDSSNQLVHRPHFVDNNDQFTSDSMKYNFDSKRALVYNARTVQGEGFVFGEKTYKDPQNNTYVKNARYTTCNDSIHPHFYILAKKFKIIPGKQVVTGPANLVIAGVNTPLVIPFGFFPLQKGQTKGIIFPTYGEDKSRGFFLRNLGYYLPINKYMDLAVSGDYFFRGSYGIHVNSNYARRYRFRGNIGFDFNQNKYGEKETGITVLKDYSLKWHYTMDQKARPGQSFNANVNYQSPGYNKNNSFQQQNIIQSIVQSNINYSTSFFKNNLNVTAGSRITQNLAKEEVDLTLPEMSLNIPRITPFQNLNIRNKALKSIGLSYNGNIENRVFMKQKNLGPAIGLENNPENIHIADSLSNGMIHSIPLNASIKLFKFFQLNPSISYNEYWYLKKIVKSWDTINDTLIYSQTNGFNRASSISGNLSLNTQLFGLAQFKRGRLQAIRHVITPSLNFGFRPNLQTEKNGFRQVQVDTSGRIEEYSIYGAAPLGYPSGKKSASIGFGINNNLELKTRKQTDTGIISKKVKLIEMLSISANHNFLADSFKWSHLSFNGRSSLFKGKVGINYNWNLDPYKYDSRRRDVLIISDGKSLGRLTAFGLSMGTNFNPQARKPKTSPNADKQELAMINNYPQFYVDFNIPWSLALNYNLNYNRPNPNMTGEFSQSITFNGDLKLTENWKIAFGSGYDFKTKELSVTKIDLFRDLHCWEFSFGWIPTGFRRSFDFTIRVKSSTLQDLKLNRRNFWFNN
jgi:lipopolysaccharide assembly outer membrane protein LptD (OstA)